MLNAEYFKRIDAMNFTLLHDDGQLPARSRRGRRGAGRREPHLEDADRDLSRQPRRQDRQHPARPGARRRRPSRRPASRWSSASSPVPSASCRSARTGCSACTPTTIPPMSTATRSRRRSHLAAPLRPQRLADDRRDPPLDRGDGGGDPRPLPRPPPASSSRWVRHERQPLWTRRRPLSPGLDERDPAPALLEAPASPSRRSRPASTSAPSRPRPVRAGRPPGGGRRWVSPARRRWRSAGAIRSGWCSAPTRRSSLDGEVLHKPADREAAARISLRLAGRPHALHSAVALARGGRCSRTVRRDAPI